MTSGGLSRGILAGLVTVAIVAVVGAGVFAWDRLDGRAAGAPTITSAPQVPPAASAPAGACRRAQPNLFAALSAHLVRDGRSFAAEQYAAEDGGGLTYLSAPVRDAAGVVRSTDPVWVYGGSGYAWLNEPAHRLSPDLPDARRLYTADPAGSAATQVAGCTTGSARPTPVGGR